MATTRLETTRICCFVVLCASLATHAVFAETDEEKGLRIARQNEAAIQGFKGERAEAEMVLINAHGDQTTRRMEIKTLEMADDGDRSMITFEWPADVKGVRLLTWSHGSKDNDQWLYLSSVKRVKRISSRNQSGAFMGSEFAFEDLGSQEVDKYRHRFIEEAEFGGRPCWVTERIPVNPRSGYSKQVVWTDTTYHQPVKIDYYDRKQEPLKQIVFADFRQIASWWRPHTAEMTNLQTKKRTIVTWKMRELVPDYEAIDFESGSLAD
jgi:hypothetical protein